MGLELQELPGNNYGLTEETKAHMTGPHLVLEKKSKRNWRAVLPFLFLAMLLTQAFFAVAQKNPQPLRMIPDGGGSSVAACPLQTLQQWQEFIQKSADNPKWVETCEDSSCDNQYVDFVQKNIQNTFITCGPFLAQHSEINSCSRHLRNFTTAWLQQHSDDTYGFTVDNHTYLTGQESPDRPSGMMKLPQALEDSLPDLNKVIKAAQDNGWKYLVHDSALGGFRTFIMIPDPQGRYDQWALINLQKGKSSIENGTPLSMVAVQKKDAWGNRLPQVQVHFRDYSIDHVGSNYRLSLYEGANGKCYSCHTSGMRQLIARRTPILEAAPVKGEAGFGDGNYLKGKDFAMQRLAEFNRRIRSYGMPDWDGKIIPENHGPILGASHSCTECHDGQSRGVLTVATSPNQLRQKIVTELVMPPNRNLPRWLEHEELKIPPTEKQEKELLAAGRHHHENIDDDFYAQRFPELKKWLVEKPCVLNE